VFKTTGPGKKMRGLRNLPCGQGGCWVCGKMLGKLIVQAKTLACLVAGRCSGGNC
jgi:hypothetical protein